MTKEYDLKDESEFWNLYFDELSKAIEEERGIKSDIR